MTTWTDRTRKETLVMRIRTVSALAAAVCIFGVSALQGQESTEQFIPIGKSPGMSGMYSMIGEVVSVDAQNRTVTVRNDEQSRTIRITDDTRIWLDRSQLQQAATTGSMVDLQTGRTVEIKFADYEVKENADWIKIGMT